MERPYLTAHFKRTVAALVSTLCLTPAYADDIIIGDDEMFTESKAQALIEGDIIVGIRSGAEITLSDNSVFNGNIISYAPQDSIADTGLVNINLMGHSQWNGNVSGKVNMMINLKDSAYSGNIGIPSNLNFNLTNSHYSGDVNITGDKNEYAFFYSDLTDGSSWLGDILIANASLNLTLSHNSIREGDLRGSNLTVYSILSDNVTLTGNITNLVDSRHGTNVVSLAHNSVWHGDGYMYLDGANRTTALQNIQIQDGSSWVGNAVFDTANNTQWSASNNVAINENSSWKGDAILSNGVVSRIFVNGNASWQGNLVLNDYDYPQAAQDLGLTEPSLIEITNNAAWTGQVISDGAYTDVRLESSHWTITGDSQLNHLHFTGAKSTVSFDDVINARGIDYQTLTIKDLEGDGDFTLRAGYYGPSLIAGDKIIITGDKTVSGLNAGNYSVTVINNGANSSKGTETLTLIETIDGLDTFTQSGNVELGGYVYSLEQDGNNWVLRPGGKGTASRPTLSDPASAAANSAQVSYLMRYLETQTLYQRMGDLRQGHQSGDLWVRGYYGGFDKLNGGLINGFDMRYNGMQIGLDKPFTLESGRFYLGGMFGVTQGKQRYQTGDGNAKSGHVGLYASYVNDNGLYVDGLVKYDYLKNNFSVADTQGDIVTGHGESKGASGSIEAGKRFYLGQNGGVYLEPQAQLSVSWQDNSRVRLSNGLKVELGSYTSTLARAGLQFGYEVNSAVMPFNVYFKTGYVRELDGKVHYRLNGSDQEQAFDGGWMTNGVGVSLQAYGTHHFYLDMEKSNGDSFNQHQLNVGYRYSF